MMILFAVLQDGRSAHCGVFHDAGFWMRLVKGGRVFDCLRKAVQVCMEVD